MRVLSPSIFICLLIDLTHLGLATPTKILAKQNISLERAFAFSVPTNTVSQCVSVRPRASFDSLHEHPSGWVGRVQKQLSFLPVQIAAGYLTTFYNNVVVQVTSEWVNKPPVNHFTIGWENIQLEFFSATRTVPWNFVIAFAEKMLGETQLGFTGKYEVCENLVFDSHHADMLQVFYLHLPTGEQIFVTLLIPLAAAGALI